LQGRRPVISVAPDICKIHRPIDACEGHLVQANSKKLRITPGFDVAHGAASRVYLQQSGEKSRQSKNNYLRSDGYGYYLSCYERPAIRGQAATNLAAFTSASGLFTAAVRGACNPNRSVPVTPMHSSGSEFSAVEMKEHDA
jgi:hypothetical protein